MLSYNLARNISYLDYKYDIEKYLSDFKRTHVLSCSMFSKMLFSKYTEENTVDIYTKPPECVDIIHRTS